MFIVQDKNGNRISAIEANDEELKSLSSNKEIFCPECNSYMIFRAGQKKIHHFAHSTKCNYKYHEPETIEHQLGKLLIKKHFEKLYPNSKVELEFRIKKTNQRSDVVIIHPNNEIWAIEFQCSKILANIWEERHLLYKEAGIKDIWIFGESVHNYGKSENEINTNKHKFCSLEYGVFNELESAFYLNTEKQEIRLLYKMNCSYHWSDTIVICKDVISDFNNVSIYKNGLVIAEVQEKLKMYEEEQAKKREEELRAEEEERTKREYWEKKSVNYLKEIKKERIQLTDRMTNKEKDEFKNLCQKYGFNSNNFPPILHSDTDYCHLIITPTYLWQLWIYDKFIFKKVGKLDKVWVPKVLEEFKLMVSKRIFRVSYTTNDNAHYSFAIYDFFKNLNEVGIAERLSIYNGKYQRIICDEIPIYNDLDDNAMLCKGISTFADDDSRDYKDRFIKDVYKVTLIRRTQVSETERGRKKDFRFLPYLVSLIDVKKELVNDWELGFLKNQLEIVQKGRLLSEKQIELVMKIKVRVENTLNINLDFKD